MVTQLAEKVLLQFLEDKEDYLLEIAVLEKNDATLSLKELDEELSLDHDMAC